MIPPSSRSFCLPSRPRAFLVGLLLLVAATFGAGGGPELFAQQSVPGPTPRRAESSARTSKQGQRAAATASNATPKRGAQVGASGAATTAARGRSPAVARAATSGVRQTSATVSADGGVVLAGGALASADCRQCGRQGCGKCRPVGDRLGLHCNGLCEQGGCPAHCPVRPDQFGYYATRWRSWPGQGVKQVGHFDPATTPVVPPRSEVPGMEDELALPSQRDEAAPNEEEEEEEEAMADAEDDAGGKNDAPAGDAEPAAGADSASGSEGGLPEGGELAPSASESEDTEASSGDQNATPSNAPSKASGPRDVPPSPTVLGRTGHAPPWRIRSRPHREASCGQAGPPRRRRWKDPLTIDAMAPSSAPRPSGWWREASGPSGAGVPRQPLRLRPRAKLRPIRSVE